MRFEVRENSSKSLRFLIHFSREVEFDLDKKQWGCKLKEGTNTFVSVKAHHDKFLEMLCRTI